MTEQKFEIHLLQEKDRQEWDEYVQNHPQSTFFHLSGWKNAIEKTFGYKPYYFFAKKEGKIRAILPLFFLQSLLGGKAMVSLPFAVYGGVCADDLAATDFILEEANKITKERKAGYMELRQISTLKTDLPTKDLYVTFIKELPSTKEECLERFPRKARASARKGISSGLETQTGLQFLKDFYHIYAVSVRNLGSPVFSFSFLKNILQEFPKNTDVLMVQYNHKPIAGVLSFFFKDTVLPYFGGSLPEYWEYQPNNFMYLKLMEYGVEKGYRYFDFGRSKKGTGSYDFKVNQGFDAQPLFYQYCLNTIPAMPDTSSLNPKLGLAIKVWKRLPVWLTKVLGPKVVKMTPP